MSVMTIIANPIYDSVFKYLMEVCFVAEGRVGGADAPA